MVLYRLFSIRRSYIISRSRVFFSAKSFAATRPSVKSTAADGSPLARRRVVQESLASVSIR